MARPMTPSMDLKWMLAFAIVLQLFCLLVGAGDPDGLRIWFVATAAYWGGAGLILARRRKQPTDLDIILAGVGYPFLVFLSILAYLLVDWIYSRLHGP